MPQNIHNPAVELAGSSVVAVAALPASTGKYIRVVNGTNGIAYCNAGASSTMTVTSANSGVAPNSTDFFEKIRSFGRYLGSGSSFGWSNGGEGFYVNSWFI